MNINNGILEDILLFVSKNTLKDLLMINNSNINIICKNKSFRNIYMKNYFICCPCNCENHTLLRKKYDFEFIYESMYVCDPENKCSPNKFCTVKLKI